MPVVTDQRILQNIVRRVLDAPHVTRPVIPERAAPAARSRAKRPSGTDRPTVAPVSDPAHVPPAATGVPPPGAGPPKETQVHNQAAVSDARPVLDRADPMGAARAMIAALYIVGPVRTLHHWRGGFWQWDGARYRDASKTAVEAAAWRWLDRAQHRTPAGELVSYHPNRARVGDVVAALAADTGLEDATNAPAWLSSDGDQPPAREFMAVPNGLLHLPSGELYPPSPAYFGLACCGVAYESDAPDPAEWRKFLRELWPDDDDAIAALQQWAGYCLSSDTSQQKIMLLVGPPRSGKGTIARVLTALLGPDSVAAPTFAGLATNFGLSPLIGRSLAIIGDARLSGRTDRAIVTERLLSISGEDMQSIDRKHAEIWTGRLGTRIMILTNDLLDVSDASAALASRFLALVMTVSFLGREDHGLADRLMGELPGILKWAVDGYQELRRRGRFRQPVRGGEAVEEMENLASPVLAFVRECCMVHAGLIVEKDALHKAFQTWCAEQGIKRPDTKNVFMRNLRSAVPGLRLTRPRSDGQRRLPQVAGIALTEEGRERVRQAEGERAGMGRDDANYSSDSNDDFSL
jgi:putative DNA primase/helicase